MLFPRAKRAGMGRPCVLSSLARGFHPAGTPGKGRQGTAILNGGRSGGVPTQVDLHGGSHVPHGFHNPHGRRPGLRRAQAGPGPGGYLLRGGRPHRPSLRLPHAWSTEVPHDRAALGNCLPRALVSQALGGALLPRQRALTGTSRVDTRLQERKPLSPLASRSGPGDSSRTSGRMTGHQGVPEARFPGRSNLATTGERVQEADDTDSPRGCDLRIRRVLPPGPLRVEHHSLAHAGRADPRPGRRHLLPDARCGPGPSRSQRDADREDSGRQCRSTIPFTTGRLRVRQSPSRRRAPSLVLSLVPALKTSTLVHRRKTSSLGLPQKEASPTVGDDSQT